MSHERHQRRREELSGVGRDADGTPGCRLEATASLVISGGTDGMPKYSRHKNLCGLLNVAPRFTRLLSYPTNGRAPRVI